MDFDCIFELLYIILSLISYGFNIPTTYCLPKIENKSDSCTKQIDNEINFCKRLNDTIFAFGIILTVYFGNLINFCCCKLCRFIVVEYFIILIVIIQWSLTLGLMNKINQIFECVIIEEEINIKVIFILFCFFLITLIIRLILVMIKENFQKFTILNIIIFIFEICFIIINLIFLPNKSSYKLDNLKYDIEEQMINSKEINQAILAFLIIIIFCFVLKLILYAYFKYKNKFTDDDEICFLKTFIIIQTILLFITWSMSLSLLSKLNKIRKIDENMNLIDDIRKNIIIVIIIISCYIILFISDIICIYFDNIKDYFNSLKFKPFFLFNSLEIVFIIIILSLFPYEKYYKSNYFNEICSNNTYNIS